MSEVSYQSLQEYLNAIKKNQFAPVYLIHGDEFLYKKALEKLVDAILTGSSKSLCYESLDGNNENIPEAIEKVNTFSLLSSEKVVALCDSRVFYAKQDSGQLLKKVKQAVIEEDFKKAGKFFSGYLGLLSLTLDDVCDESRQKSLGLDEKSLNGEQWLEKLILYCRSEGISASSTGSYAMRLQKAIEKGFPKGNHLIITTDLTDKRRGLYRIIKEQGSVIDCSVPKGARKVDKDAQNAILNKNLKAILDKNGKTIDAKAYMALYEMTGFDLRTFTGNIEKLISYVGDRKEITVSDIEFILNRTKIDPIYEVTNAVADRNAEKALFFIASLVSKDFHPLQIMAAVTNQIRRLLLCRSLVENLKEKSWHKKMPFAEFKSKIIPLINNHDKLLLDELMIWDDLVNPLPSSDETKQKEKRKKKKSITTDLFIAKNPNNPYPIYQLMLKSENFSSDDLMTAMDQLNRADRLMKTTAQDARLILEKTVINICSSDGRILSEMARGES